MLLFERLNLFLLVCKDDIFGMNRVLHLLNLQDGRRDPRFALTVLLLGISLKFPHLFFGLPEHFLGFLQLELGGQDFRIGFFEELLGLGQ